MKIMIIILFIIKPILYISTSCLIHMIQLSWQWFFRDVWCLCRWRNWTPSTEVNWVDGAGAIGPSKISSGFSLLSVPGDSLMELAHRALCSPKRMFSLSTPIVPVTSSLFCLTMPPPVLLLLTLSRILTRFPDLSGQNILWHISNFCFFSTLNSEMAHNREKQENGMYEWKEGDAKHQILSFASISRCGGRWGGLGNTFRQIRLDPLHTWPLGNCRKAILNCPPWGKH